MLLVTVDEKMKKIIENALQLAPYYKVFETENEKNDNVRYIFVDIITGREVFEQSHPTDYIKSLETDILVTLFYNGDRSAFNHNFNNEKDKAILRKKFNVRPVMPMEEIGTKKLLNLPDENLKLKATQEKQEEKLEELLKRTKKVTRYCQEVSCNEKIKIYRSKLALGKGLYCCRSHASMNKFQPHITNQCKNCKIEYESIFPEDFCSDECEEFYRTLFCS